ncbi:MAG: hypothetical protein R3B13_33895 [Polyangiaceae bacterium]
MDSHLRKYLEQPPPRPLMQDARFDDRRVRWLFPLGAAFTGALVLGGIVRERREWFGTCASIWLAFIVLAHALGRWLSAREQSLFRTGTFGEATVLASALKVDGEDSSLEVTLGVDTSEPGAHTDAAAPAADYRRPAKGEETHYRMSLSDRWLRDDGEKRFAVGARFPILTSAHGRAARVFIDDEVLDAGVI